MSDHKHDDGGEAYPACNEAWVNNTKGMTLLDYFAGQALAGLYANYAPDADNSIETAAEIAYDTADAMIAEKRRRGALK